MSLLVHPVKQKKTLDLLLQPLALTLHVKVSHNQTEPRRFQGRNQGGTRGMGDTPLPQILRPPLRQLQEAQD